MLKDKQCDCCLWKGKKRTVEVQQQLSQRAVDDDKKCIIDDMSSSSKDDSSSFKSARSRRSPLDCSSDAARTGGAGGAGGASSPQDVVAQENGVRSIGRNTVEVDLTALPTFMEETNAERKVRDASYGRRGSSKKRGIITSADLIHIGSAKDIQKRKNLEKACPSGRQKKTRPVKEENGTTTRLHITKEDSGGSATNGTNGDCDLSEISLSPRSPVYNYNVGRRRNNRLDEFLIFTDHTPFTKAEMEDIRVFPMADASSSVDETVMDSNVRFVVSLYRAMNNWLVDPKSAEIDRGVLLHPQIADLLKTNSVYVLKREKRTTTSMSSNALPQRNWSSSFSNPSKTAAQSTATFKKCSDPSASSTARKADKPASSNNAGNQTNGEANADSPSSKGHTPSPPHTGERHTPSPPRTGERQSTPLNSSPLTDETSQAGLMSSRNKTPSVSPKPSWLVKPPLGYGETTTGDDKGEVTTETETGDKMATGRFVEISKQMRLDFTRRNSSGNWTMDVKECCITWVHPTNTAWRGLFVQTIVKNCAAEKLEALLYDPKMYTTIDKAASQGIVYESHNAYQIKYGEYPGNFFVSTRGVFAITRRFRFSDNPSTRMILSRCIPVPDSVKEERTWKALCNNKPPVLANAMSAYIIEQLPRVVAQGEGPTEEGDCRVTLVSHLNPGGNVEKSQLVGRSAVGRMASEVLTLIKNVGACAQKYATSYQELQLES